MFTKAHANVSLIGAFWAYSSPLARRALLDAAYLRAARETDDAFSKLYAPEKPSFSLGNYVAETIRLSHLLRGI